MNLNDYIIISRNSLVYKAKIELLSSVIAFYFSQNLVSSDFMKLSSTIENTYTTYGDTHYSKSEMKSDFCSKESINNLTANSTYALTSLAKTKLNSLSSKANVDKWCTKEKENCYEVLSKEFLEIDDIMEGFSLDGYKAQNYAHPPDDKKIESEIKEQDPNPIN